MKLAKLVAFGFLTAALFATSASAFTRYTSTTSGATNCGGYYHVGSPSFVPKLIWVGADGFSVQNPATGVQYFCGAPFPIACTNTPLGSAGVKQMLASMLWCIQNNKSVALTCNGTEGTCVVWDQFSISN